VKPTEGAGYEIQPTPQGLNSTPPGSGQAQGKGHFSVGFTYG